MRIDIVNNFRFIQNIQDREKKTNKNINFMGTPEVPKTLERFGTLWYIKLPVTFRNFFDNLKDKSIYSPLQALGMAFSGLFFAKNIQDVKNAFPQECGEDGLFTNLKDYKTTDTADALLSVYRENKELYPNGILKSGEDLTVYLLKKLFLEGKTKDDINRDLENDLNENIKSEFKRKFPERNGEYIGNGSFQKTFGIKRLDRDCFNSFLQTQEEFNKKFRESCVQGQINRYNSESSEQSEENKSNSKTSNNSWSRMTPEQIEERKEKIRQKNIERWNKLTPEQQFKIIASLNKGFDSWWKKLPEAEKERRISLLTAGWYKLTPAQRTALINKIKASNEPLRYAMYDTWNNSIDLILELSKFLKSKHELRPSDLYSAEEFNDFQSKIMTEFWTQHKDMGEEFGLRMSIAKEKIDTAIKDGQFEELKKQIETERDERVQLVETIKQAEEQNINESITPKETSKTEEIREPEAKTISPNILQGYGKDFKNAYKEYMNRDLILPAAFIGDIVNIVLDGLSPEMVQQMTKRCKERKLSLDDIANIFKENGDIENYKKVIRSQRAIEGALSYVLYMRINGNPKSFGMDYDTLTDIYRHKMKGCVFTYNPNMTCCIEKYEEYKRSLSEDALNDLVNRYFVYKSSDDAKLIADYINLYGRSALILFSENSKLENEARMNFNDKFLKMMPEEVKNICIPVIKSPVDLVAEQIIQKIRDKVLKRYSFMPKDFLNAYAEEVVNTIHVNSRVGTKQAKETYSIKSFEENVCNTKSTTINGEDYTNYPYLKIPKISILKDNKIKILAAEQALADELFRVTGNEKIYEVELEELMNIFEIFTAQNTDMIIFDEQGNKRFEASERPSRYHLKRIYQDYLEGLNENADKIFEEDNIKDAEELLYTLNPEVGNEHRDEYIAKRIKVYYDEPGWQTIESFAEFNANS